MLLWLAHKLDNLFFCKSLIYANQITIHYQLYRCTPKLFLRFANFMTACLILTFLLEVTKKCNLSTLLLMRLLSKQLNKVFEDSSNETIKLSVSFAVAYYSLSSTWFAISWVTMKRFREICY